MCCRTIRIFKRWFYLQKGDLPLCRLTIYVIRLQVKSPGYGDLSGSPSGMTERLVGHGLQEDDLVEAYLRMIFNSVRNEVSKSINNAGWINENLSGHLLKRLSEIELQIGFSERVTTTEEFINGYYDNFLIRLRANNLISRWEFVKHKMEHRMQNGTNRDEV